MNKHFTIPIFIPELGCPFQCIFCNQRSITGTRQYPSAEDIESIIKNHLATIDKGSFIEIGFFGGNFTGIPKKIQEEYLNTANKYYEYKIIKGIRISTRPDYINDNILSFLKNNKITTIELGVQSLDDEVLYISKRGYKSSVVYNASERIKKYGFRLGHQIMIGLPGSTTEKEIKTAKDSLSLKPDDIRIYPLLVIKDTEIEREYIEGRYNPLSINEAVQMTKEVIKVFYGKTNIIRVGLHPSSDLQNKDFTVGPFHSSFRELVMTSLWKEVIIKIKDYFKNSNELEIIISPKDYNNFIGYKKENKKILLENFKIKILKSEVKEGKVIIKSKKETKEFNLVD
jgi:histone acetyltransferase (RNA polymerase elongator complex component)